VLFRSRAFSAKRGLEFHAISSATGDGIVELVRAMADALDRIPKPAVPADPADAPAPDANAAPRDDEHEPAVPDGEDR
jgi:hypothetical protein